MHVHSAPLKPGPYAAFLCKRTESPFSQSYPACLETMETSLTIPSRDYQVLVRIYRASYSVLYFFPFPLPKPVLEFKLLVSPTKLLINLPDSGHFHINPFHRMLIYDFSQFTSVIVSLSCSKTFSHFPPASPIKCQCLCLYL